MEEKEQEHKQAQENLYVADIHVAYQNWEHGRIDKTLDLLRQHIPQGAEPDLRGWEWYYLLSLCHRDERTLTGHTGAVYAVSCDPAGRRFASAGQDHTVRIWDAESSACLAVLKGHDAEVVCVEWCPDGRRLASGGWDGKLSIWDAENFQKLFVLDYGQRVWTIAWSPDGNQIAAGGVGPNTTGTLPTALEGLLVIWNAASGQRLHNLAGAGAARSLVWHPDGKLLASAINGEGLIQVWDTQNGQLVRTLVWGTGNGQLVRTLYTTFGPYEYSVAWKPDGRQLASAGSDQQITVWDADTWKSSTRIPVAHHGQVQQLMWSEDGQYLDSCGTDGVIRIWDPQTGAVINALRAHETGVNSIARWHGHGRILSGGEDGTLRVWNPQSEQAARTISGISACAWSPDGRQIAVGDTLANKTNGVVRIMDVATWKPLFTLPAGVSNSWPGVLAWSPDGRRLAAGFYVPGEVRVWDLASRRETLFLPKAHGGNFVRTVAWSPKSRLLATAGEDRAVRLWSVETKQNFMTFLEHSNMVSSAVWSPDGKWIASKDFEGVVLIWATHTGKVRLKLQSTRSSPGKPYDVAWSPQGDELAAGSGDGTITVWDVNTGREVHSLRGHTSNVRSVAWSPDGRRLVSGAEDRTVRVWDAQSGRELLVLPDPSNQRPAVAWNCNGRMISTVDRKARIFDATDGYELAPQLKPRSGRR